VSKISLKSFKEDSDSQIDSNIEDFPVLLGPTIIFIELQGKLISSIPLYSFISTSVITFIKHHHLKTAV